MNIAVVGKLYDDTFGIRADYVRFFGNLGQVSIVAPMPYEAWSHVVRNYDMVVLPGGGDINPLVLRQLPSMATGKSDPILEYFDKTLLPLTLEKCLVVGICRGLQALAVHATDLASRFAQDLPGHPHSEVWDDRIHAIEVRDGRKAWGYKVNSLHHQGVLVKTGEIDEIERDLKINILATSGYVGDRVVVEALEGRNFLGVQWHPEALGDHVVLHWIQTKLENGWVRSPSK